MFSTLNHAYPELPEFYDSGVYVSGASSFPGQVSHVANAFELPETVAGISGFRLDMARWRFRVSMVAMRLRWPS